MKIGILMETSTAMRNKDVVEALKSSAHEVYNLGLTGDTSETQLTTVETGFMSALILNLRCVDMVVGGCGTGQGYMNSVLQYPGIVCGLIDDPLHAWLFSQINAGNCISLALNKGYGWAGEVNLKFIFDHLFEKTPGIGYPPCRMQAQKSIRERQKEVSVATHLPFQDILSRLDPEMVRRALMHRDFYKFVLEHAYVDLPLFDVFKRYCSKLIGV
ncbi:MAG: RpiB/LacA/LacB family sugar-phosphate isomerase [Bacillota bacterium]